MSLTNRVGTFFILLGVAPRTDIVAHFGGFISGLILGIPLAFRPRLARSPRLNLVCGILAALLVIIPWSLALSR